MLIKNAVVLTDDFKFKKLDVKLENGIITKIGENIDSSFDIETINAETQYLLPGFVDIHTHGCMGYDTCDADLDQYDKMSEFYASRGVTSFLFTTMTYSEEILSDILKKINQYMKSDCTGAKARGIYLEGPFINHLKKGAQSEKYIIAPDIRMFERLYSVSGQNIKIVSIAPEMNEGIEFIKKISKYAVVALGHTNADYDVAIEAYESGALDTTHLFNAMPSYHHRNPGVIGAAFEKSKFIEIICDGIHVHPSVIRNTFNLVGSERMILISDSVRAAGMPDGKYTLGGQEITLKDNKAFLNDGTIAGSAGNLASCVKNCIDFGIKPENAIRAATINPAKVIGMGKEIGSIAVGKAADLVLMTKDFQINNVIIGGKLFI